MHEMSRATAALVVLFASLVLPSARAQSGAVENALETLDAALARERELSEPTRQALRGLVTALRAEREAGPNWIEMERRLDELVDDHNLAPVSIGKGNAFPTLKFSGDFRFRHESSFGLDGATDRHRQRVRFRLQSDFAIDDEFSLRARLVTGDPDDPNSPHHTLGTVFDKVDANFDRLNVKYRPSWAPGLTGILGKFSNPIRRNPVYGEIVWDEDVQPEGVAVVYSTDDLEGIKRLDLSAGFYNVLEQGTRDDAFAFSAQAAITFALAAELDLETAVAYFNWTDPTPDGGLGVLGDNAGNAVVDRNGDGAIDDYLSDFGIVDSFVALTWNGWDHPITLSGEIIWNSRAEGDRDLGWSAGFAIGKASKPGDWKVYYAYHAIEQDAVFSPVAQDDFLFQTNQESHLFGVKYKITESMDIHLWTLISARDTLGNTPTTDGDAEQYRIRVDLNISF